MVGGLCLMVGGLCLSSWWVMSLCTSIRKVRMIPKPLVVSVWVKVVFPISLKSIYRLYRTPTLIGMMITRPTTLTEDLTLSSQGGHICLL